MMHLVRLPMSIDKNLTISVGFNLISPWRPIEHSLESLLEAIACNYKLKYQSWACTTKHFTEVTFAILK
jgi:hypothetical protein